MILELNILLMMKLLMSESFVTGLFTLSGVILGGVVALSSKLTDRRIARRENINNILMNLLNVNAFFNARFHFVYFPELIEERLKKDFQELTLKPDEKEKVRKFMMEFSNHIDNVEEGEYERIHQNYEKAITDLSKIDPLIAYQLQGHANITSFKKISEKLFAIGNENSKPGLNFKNEYLDINMKDILSSRIEKTEEYLLEISRKYSKNKFKEINDFIEKKRQKDKDQIEKIYIERIKPFIKTDVKK